MYQTNKTLEDAPPEMNSQEAAAWLRGVEAGFNEAMDIIAERDAGADI